MANTNIEIQWDAKIVECGEPAPLTFSQIEQIRNSVNAPLAATFKAEPTGYGFEIHIHWNDDF